MLIPSSAKSVRRRSPKALLSDKYALGGKLRYAPGFPPPTAPVEPPQEQPKSEKADAVVAQVRFPNPVVSTPRHD